MHQADRHTPHIHTSYLLIYQINNTAGEQSRAPIEQRNQKQSRAPIKHYSRAEEKEPVSV